MKPLDVSEQAIWKQRYLAQSIRWAQIAPQNKEHGLVCSNMSGKNQLYAWHRTTNQLHQLTNHEVGIGSGVLSADGQWVYFHQDQQGNEIGHFYQVPFAGGPAVDLTPDMPPFASWRIAENRTGEWLGFMAVNQEGFKVYVQPKNGDRRLLYHRPGMLFGPMFSADGRWVVIESSEKSGTLENNLVILDTQTGAEIANLWDGAGSSIGLAAVSPVVGDNHLLATTTLSGYTRPFLYDVANGTRQELPLPEIAGDVYVWAWSADGQTVLLGQIYQARCQLYLYQLDQHTVHKIPHPAGVFNGSGGAFFDTNEEVITTWQGPDQPARLVRLNCQNGEMNTLLAAGECPAGRPWQSIHFPSENGVMIQAWLGVPEGVGPFPTILHTHGGPTAVMSDYFAPDLQAWLDHGFAIFSVNYQGSTTFGKAFEKSIWGNLGDLEIGDMAAAYHWLVEQKIARPEAVFPMGASYGGYLTLQALGKRPELWAGGLAVVAIADWQLMYEDQVETLRAYQRALFGGTPEEKVEATYASSPISYAENIKAPILVIQGSNDTRCPARQMRAYEEKLKNLGKSIYIHWFEAGHGGVSQEMQIEHQQLMMKFVYEWLQ